MISWPHDADDDDFIITTMVVVMTMTTLTFRRWKTDVKEHDRARRDSTCWAGLVLGSGGSCEVVVENGLAALG